MSTKLCSRCYRAFTPRARYHHLCWSCWRDEAGAPRPPETPPVVSLGLTVDVLRDAVLLTHPDRHPESRFEQANRVTAALLGALRLLQRGRAA